MGNVGFTVKIPEIIKLAEEHEKLQLALRAGDEKEIIWEATAAEVKDFCEESLIEYHIDEEQITQASAYLKEADHVLIGAGAGLSAAAGLTYSGKRFQENFSDFIKKYGLQDMYSAGFYPFQTEEERCGYWCRHSYVNRIKPPALLLYQQLFDLVKEKDYFVLTTNVDHQFQRAGFLEERIFATQGDYGRIQCDEGMSSQDL